MQPIRKVFDESWTYEHNLSEAEKSMFYYVQSTGHYYSKPIYCCRRENLDSLLIKFTLNGTGYLKYKNISYTLNQGQLFIIDCLHPHYYGSSKTDLWEMVWLHFNGGKSREYVQKILSSHGPVFDLNNDQSSRILSNLIQIQQLIKTLNHQVNIINSGLITQILTELLLKSSASSTNTVIQHPPDMVLKAVRLIENNYKKPLTLDELAAKIGISKYHLGREFKKYIGYSPYEYMIVLRLKESKILLKNTNQPVHLISSKIGFSSTSHFIKLFKKTEGVTPLQFRTMWK